VWYIGYACELRLDTPEKDLLLWYFKQTEIITCACCYVATCNLGSHFVVVIMEPGEQLLLHDP